MSLNEMSLPSDIPWKRIGVSEDMIDTEQGDLRFPEKWISSLALFYHEPTELPPDYCDRKITYLKVVCTITSFQAWETQDLTVLDELREKYGDFYAYKEFYGGFRGAFPCYGALLQVGVYPRTSFGGVDVHNYPYIASFQPRKREMYETLSQSGEIASQSANKVNVGKQIVNQDTTETYDVSQGYANSDSTSVLFGLFSTSDSKERQGQWGTINRNERQEQQVNTTDASREKRESYSYSTNINQLYSLLQGYHLGTNRAIFFMQPRPHIQDTKFTFVQGARRLEGIQEFFLIVNRPASVEGLCVDLALETAHAVLYPSYMPRLIPLSDLYSPTNLQKTAQALGIDLDTYPIQKILVETWNTTRPHDRQLFHMAIKQAFNSEAIAELNNRVDRHEISELQLNVGLKVAGMLPEIGIEDVAIIFEEYEHDEGQMFVTGRRLSACYKPVTEPEGIQRPVSMEHSSADHVSRYQNEPSIVFSQPYRGMPYRSSMPNLGAKRAGDLNAMVQNINEILRSSLSSPDRVPYGTQSFLDSELVLDEMSQLIRLLGKSGIKDKQLSEISDIYPLIKRGFGRISGAKSVLDLGAISTDQLADDFNITHAEARQIRKKVLLASLKELDPKSIDRNAPLENRIMERWKFRFPKEKIAEFESSAHLTNKSGHSNSDKSDSSSKGSL